MFRWISAAVIVCLTVVVLVWRSTGDGKETTASRATLPDVRGEAASAGIAVPETLAGERSESLPEESLEAPGATMETPPPPALVTLRGRLDDAVPRPIQDGHVMVNLDGRGFEAVVRAEGTFELTDLPAGRGQIIALCRGWVSRRTPFDAIEQVTLHLGREPTLGEIERAFQEEGPETLEAQRIVVPARDPLVVAMERTGTLEVIVKTPDGHPFADARVAATPSLRWIDWRSVPFPWRRWEATTDPWGRARIDDLPPDDAIPVAASHDTSREGGGGVKRRWESVVRIRSGEESELELVKPGN